MASFFKNLFRKDEDSQPIPAAPLTNDLPSRGRPPIFQEAGPPAPAPSHGRRNRVPSGHTGPFSAVSGRQMTAREIAALLPSTLLRFDGISPDQPVPLPVDPLRDSMQAGRPFLRLSQIQQACPELFQRPPLPEEDVEITLPLARVKGILESSAPWNAVSGDFGDATMGTPASTPPPSGNPFAARHSPAPFTAGSPFAAAGVAASTLPPVPAGSSPFAVSSAADPPPSLPPAVASPFAQVSVGPAVSLPSPFDAKPAAVASPFAAIKAATAPSIPASPVASPFTAARSVENSAPPASALSPFTSHGPAPAPATVAPPVLPPSAFSPVPTAAPPTAAVIPPNPGAVLSPSPFSQILAKSDFPAKAAFNQNPASSPPAPLSWPPTAPPAASPLPISPQPRTTAVPPPRSSPVPAAAVLAHPVPFPPTISTTPVHPAMPPVMPKASLSAPVSQSSTPPIAAPGLTASTTRIPSVGASAAMMELSLRAVLRDADPAELGFVPDNVPETVRVTLPVELVSRQLAHGRVEVSLEEICLGIAEKFRPAFARAREGLRINIPMSEVFHNLPESARPALDPAAPSGEHLSITISPFQTPFAIRAEEDTSRHLLDLTVTGFDPSNLPVRPATHPVPPPALPPAPLPPVLPAAGGPPTVQVDLPVLRPVASSSVETKALPPLTPRPGLLSRPPGSGTAPTEAPAALPIPPSFPAAPAPKSPPRLKSTPASPSALRAFPKPSAPPPAGYENGTASPVPSAPREFPLLRTPGSPPPAESLSSLPLLSASPAPAAPVSSPTSLTAVDFSDDLGESFSAAKLSAEPPPRAGSVPVSLPPLADATVSFAGTTGAPSFTVDSSLPSWPSGSLPTPVPVADLAPQDSAWLSLSETPFREFTPAPAIPVAVPQKTAALHLTATIAPRQATSPLEDLTFGCNTDLRQLTLRAVLGTDQVLTAQGIVDRCAALPGLKACVLLQAGATLASHGMDESDAATFCSSAAKTRESLATLAETMGLGTGGNFTLRTDQGVRSFFLESKLCLAVWHAQPQFSGGTREKLILIAQELAKSGAL